MGDAIAMGKPGTQFSGDGISLSWPRNRDGTPGIREVVEVPPGRRSGRVKQMILEGAVAEVDLEPTEPTPTIVTGHKLYAGGSREALRRMREPAGPVIRQMFVPMGELQETEAPTSVLEDDPDRRPEPPVVPEDEFAPPEVFEPTFEERVSSMVDENTLAALQAKAREYEIKTADVKFSSKAALAEAILSRMDAEAAGDTEAPAVEPAPDAEPEPAPEPDAEPDDEPDQE
jgi:hypothetical protein